MTVSHRPPVAPYVRFSYTALHQRIGRTVIGEHVKEKRDRRREAFIRQEYEYGDRGEYDFGEVKLVIGGIVGTYYMAVIANPASAFRWSYLYENQKKEAFMDSHVRYFQMLGGVPREKLLGFRNAEHALHEAQSCIWLIFII